MKSLLITLTLLMGANAFAQNVSSECYRLASQRMTEEEAHGFCSNVANNCFTASVRKLGLEGARNKCLNVASDCYRETKNAKICENVNNTCYRAERRYGNLSIEESIKKCFDRSF